MGIFIWAGVFVVALIALVKGADWVLDSAKKIGLALGMAPFVVGVLIVGFGTSAPELVSSLFGFFSGATEIPAANAVGSNIANILLVIGLAAVLSKSHLTITRNLIDIELPILALATALFFGVAHDGIITTPESLILIAAFVLYVLYALFNKDSAEAAPAEAEDTAKPAVRVQDIALLVLGFALLVGGAKYLIDAVLALSALLNIAVGVITILAVAVGTSLPELLVSVKAALQGDAEVSVGNIFGSNAFNILFVVGIPGIFGAMQLDTPTVAIGIPAMLAATFFLIISGISQRIHIWEGMFYLLVYVFFVLKLFGAV